MIQRIEHDFLNKSGVDLFVKRLDLLPHPVTGNKWYKLKHNINKANAQNLNTLITFGGAFSNHLYAFAKACLEYKKSGVAYVRGDKMDENNPSLHFLVKCGINIHFLDRKAYREKTNADFIALVKDKYQDSWIIPEGGSNEEGYTGTQEILDFDPSGYDVICISAGTGCTAAGVISSSSIPVEVYSALKGGFMKRNILSYNSELTNFTVIEKFNFGGFAKTDQELIEFINNFYILTSVPLDPIYNGKMLFGIFQRIQQGAYPRGTKIMVIHTGGLQGILGYNYRFPNRPIKIPVSALNV